MKSVINNRFIFLNILFHFDSIISYFLMNRRPWTQEVNFFYISGRLMHQKIGRKIWYQKLDLNCLKDLI